MKLPNKKDYPSELHIGEETYAIKLVDKIPEGLKGDIGLCDGESKMIYLDTNQTKSKIFRTLVHEILHAIEFEYDIKMKHKEVYKLEKGLADFFMMNF